MRKTSLFAAAIAATAFTAAASGQLILTGVLDGDLTGGQPKVVELFAASDIADLSTFGIGSANNGGGSDGVEFQLSGSATAGDYIWIAANQPDFNTYFGFDPTFTSGAANINGDDAIELFANVADPDGSGLQGDVIDIYGDINVNGDGEVWDYTDSFAYRVDETGPDGDTFVPGNWTFAGLGALDGVATAAEGNVPFGSYSAGNVIPEPATLGLLSVAGLGLLRRRSA